VHLNFGPNAEKTFGGQRRMMVIIIVFHLQCRVKKKKKTHYGLQCYKLEGRSEEGCWVEATAVSGPLYPLALNMLWLVFCPVWSVSLTTAGRLFLVHRG
jgi:hypothetical protein